MPATPSDLAVDRRVVPWQLLFEMAFMRAACKQPLLMEQKPPEDAGPRWLPHNEHAAEEDYLPAESKAYMSKFRPKKAVELRNCQTPFLHEGQLS